MPFAQIRYAAPVLASPLWRVRPCVRPVSRVPLRLDFLGALLKLCVSAHGFVNFTICSNRINIVFSGFGGIWRRVLVSQAHFRSSTSTFSCTYCWFRKFWPTSFWKFWHA